MREDDFIALLRPLAGPGGLDLRDDAAQFLPMPGRELVVSTDSFVEGVHFPAGRYGGGFSERLLRTALSDLAAKGARAIGYTLNVAWPESVDDRWASGFVRGLADVQAAFDCPLLGGDTVSTTGPLVASATVYGTVPEGRMIFRYGARPGDTLWHTGTLGRAALGLRIINGKSVDLSPDEFHAAETAYLRPEPRFLFRRVLRNYASAALDLTDGFSRDAHNLAIASGVRLEVTREALEAGAFGDDYELLFTSHPGRDVEMQADARMAGVPVTWCGTVKEGEGVWCEGRPVEPGGYQHGVGGA
ncbi:MAG: thiamine-phosphate kinase [Pseudomonadota bacterium]